MNLLLYCLKVYLYRSRRKKREREKKSNNELSHSCKCEHKYDLFKDWIKIKSQHIKYIEK